MMQIYIKFQSLFDVYNNFLGVSASPPAPGYKSAAGSRVAAKLQKELPPVALLQQRPHRLPSLRAFRLPPHALDGKIFAVWRLCGKLFIPVSQLKRKNCTQLQKIVLTLGDT